MSVLVQPGYFPSWIAPENLHSAESYVNALFSLLSRYILDNTPLNSAGRLWE
ncbi:hypothetical protein NW064_03680 [Mycoplasmopsis felis]|uniref:hypothetical protein n=1 Tax=Mycoplasmopsis felis TaxID=33923 RepID=UPI0021AEADBD|nr:hypothetical protein [Mycoplasmopsis felis]MCU9932080.1 hypothetical protein [Mycoplasmopsis felis]UWW00372.1 hypothetical protein NW064_03680 [Mycoplasmopsis felis]